VNLKLNIKNQISKLHIKIQKRHKVSLQGAKQVYPECNRREAISYFRAVEIATLGFASLAMTFHFAFLFVSLLFAF